MGDRPDHAPLVELLRDTARAAGDLLLDRYRSGAFSVDAKGAFDLVTSADTAAEALILGRIRASYPDHRIVAEESGAHAGDATVWYIDPLDGTLNFANHLPFWSTSLAVRSPGDGAAGVVYAPLLDEFFAADGTGATLNGIPIAVRALPVHRALVYTHIGRDAGRQALSLAIAGTLAPRIYRLRMIGSLALALAYVAAGRLDGVLQIGASSWDYMAGALLVERAGGAVSGARGEPLEPGGETVVAAATPELHRLLLETIATHWPA